MAAGAHPAWDVDEPKNLRKPTWRQRLAVCLYVYFIPTFVVLNVCMMFSMYTFVPWFLYLLYINLGPGRWASKRGNWPKALRYWSFWRHYADYFPVDLVKTAELDPEERYIFVVHPHGVATIWAWPVFDTDATGFSVKFPGIDVYPMTLEVNFRLPFMREWLLLHGVADASLRACLTLLGQGSGKAILLAVGGAQESQLARPYSNDLVLKKRKGFVRVALQTGAKLVPVFGFGENNLYTIRPTVPGSVRDVVARLFKRLAGFTLPDAIANRPWGGYGGYLPYARPLTTVVGAPVHFDLAAANLKEEDQNLDSLTDAYHAQYTAALKQLYDAHKDKYDKERRKSMEIVE